MVTIPLACASALGMLSSDASSPGALFWPAWVLVAGLLGPIAIDTLEHGLQRIFRAEYVLTVALVAVVFAELLQPSYSTYLEAESVRQTFLAIGIFASMAAFGSSLKPAKLPQAITNLASRQYSAKVIFRIMLLCWGLAMFNFLYASDFSLKALIDGLLADRWSAPWARGQLGGWDAFRDFLSNFGFVVPTFTVVLALRGGWSRTVAVGLVCSGIILAFIAQSGGRRLIVAIVGSALLTWLCAKRKHLRLRHYIMAAALVLATVIFLDIMLAQRNVGMREFTYTRSDFGGLRVDDNFRALGETLRVIPAEASFVGFQHLWYVIVRPIPRIFWQGKPTGAGFDLAQHLGEPGVALSITAIGELYMSFGWLGIVVGGVGFGWLARCWSQLLEKDYGVIGTALYGLGTMTIFLGVRSLLELVLMTYPILCWYAVDLLIFKVRRADRRLKPIPAHQGV